MARTTRTPVLLPCEGVSSRGVSAAEAAAELAARGLAEIADDAEQALAADRGRRPVIAVDACAGSCQARLLVASGLRTVRTLELPRAAAAGGPATAAELEAATRPFRQARPPRPAPPGDAGEHRVHSPEDYLLALDTLTSPVVECGALADAPTLAAHVARILGVSRPSAGAMLDRLERAGQIRRGKRREITLTVRGRADADRVVRKHRILECFAAQALGYRIDECYERARELAAGFDEDAADRTWRAAGRPSRCPHGWPIDPRLARSRAHGLRALSSTAAGESITVERLEEASRARLQALHDAGIEPGRALTSVVTRPAAGVIAFVAGGEPHSISTVLAASVLVRRRTGRRASALTRPGGS